MMTFYWIFGTQKQFLTSSITNYDTTPHMCNFLMKRKGKNTFEFKF